MNKDLEELSDIIRKFPFINDEIGERTLQTIPIESAAVIWHFARRYLSIAEELDADLTRIRENSKGLK